MLRQAKVLGFSDFQIARFVLKASGNMEKGEKLEYTKETERLNQQKTYQERAAFFHRARSLDDITCRDEAR